MAGENKQTRPLPIQVVNDGWEPAAAGRTPRLALPAARVSRTRATEGADATGNGRPKHGPGRPMPLLRQYVRFSLVGLSNAVVDLGALNLLLALHPTHAARGLLVDNTLAVALAILNSYLWNMRWTFRAEATHTPRERALFIAQAVLNIGLNNLVLLVLTPLLNPAHGSSIWDPVAGNVAKLLAMVLASTTSFILLRTVVFRHGRDHRRWRAMRRTVQRTSPGRDISPTLSPHPHAPDPVHEGGTRRPEPVGVAATSSGERGRKVGK